MIPDIGHFLYFIFFNPHNFSILQSVLNVYCVAVVITIHEKHNERCINIWIKQSLQAKNLYRGFSNILFQGIVSALSTKKHDTKH